MFTLFFKWREISKASHVPYMSIYIFIYKVSFWNHVWTSATTVTVFFSLKNRCFFNNGRNAFEVQQRLLRELRRSGHDQEEAGSFSFPQWRCKLKAGTYKWSYNPYKWPYKRVTGFFPLLTGVITPFRTGWGLKITEKWKRKSIERTIHLHDFGVKTFIFHVTTWRIIPGLTDTLLITMVIVSVP